MDQTLGRQPPLSSDPGRPLRDQGLRLGSRGRDGYRAVASTDPSRGSGAGPRGTMPPKSPWARRGPPLREVGPAGDSSSPEQRSHQYQLNPRLPPIMSAEPKASISMYEYSTADARANFFDRRHS